MDHYFFHVYSKLLRSTLKCDLSQAALFDVINPYVLKHKEADDFVIKFS